MTHWLDQFLRKNRLIVMESRLSSINSVLYILNAKSKPNDLFNQKEMDGPVFKIKDDPRIICAGKFIRKTSFDELSQLLNIFKGDMSIVDPRLVLPREMGQYGEYEKQRLYVTPGLGCYWQIGKLYSKHSKFAY